MKPWAKQFYKSKAWRKCRDAYFSYRHGLCERCNGPGKIVHHKEYLTPENINDPNVSLNFEKLELLCQDCHNIEHHSSPATEEGLMFDEQGNLVERRESSNTEYTKRFLSGETMPGSYDWAREQEKWKMR